MKKVIIALLVVGAVIALRSAAGRSAQKLREHCKQMAGKCGQMMAGQPGKGEATGMREHCKEMFATHGASADEREHAEQGTPQFEDQGKAAAV